MGEVFIAGASMVPMGKYPNSSYAGLAAPTLLEALRVAKVESTAIEELYCGHAFGGMLTGQRIAKSIGIGGVPIINVDNACSGGATALHLGYRAISDGRADVVAVVGVDKLTQFGGGTLPLVEEDTEVQAGIVMPAIYAMRAQRFMHDRGVRPDQVAAVSVKARKHGALNPLAQFRSLVTVEEVLASKMIADPLTLLQCCPTGDGAATVILISEEKRKRLEEATPAVKILSSALHSGTIAAGYRDMTTPNITIECASEAFEAAGISPADIDVVELHDAFSIAELIYYEALSLCAKGEAVALFEKGETTFGGRVVVNPSGGLLAKGHPVGASGVAQAVEIFWQLTAQAEDRQVEGARFGLTHVTGGGLTGLDHGACTIHIFEAVG